MRGGGRGESRERNKRERKSSCRLPGFQYETNPDSLHPFSNYLLSTSSVLQASRLTSCCVIRLSLS